LARPASRLVFFIVFLTLTSLGTAYHSVEWYALLGEVPATLAMIVAALVWSRDFRSLRYAFLGGILLGVGALAKKLLLIYVGAIFAVAVIYLRFVVLTPAPALGRAIGSAASGFLLEPVSFELYRLLVS
jgi:hypothetical protein